MNWLERARNTGTSTINPTFYKTCTTDIYITNRIICTRTHSRTRNMNCTLPVLLATDILHGSMPKQWTFFVGLLVVAPGINGAPGTKLRALAADRAVRAGFGRGEFQGPSRAAAIRLSIIPIYIVVVVCCGDEATCLKILPPAIKIWLYFYLCFSAQLRK